jgi:phenylalanyl-tRNA synthetase beta chain
MKVLLSWLREFAPFDGDPVELGRTMSDLGMAVESLDRLGEGLDGIVVARVLDLRPHPDADRIQLVDVDTGDGESLQICCGAFNMAVGDLVPLAVVGTVMPDGLEIARRKLRGEWSNGMLCSSRELGMGTDHAGIMVLPPSAEVGADLAGALGIESDVLYDLEINPNRPDAMSVVGVARDLAGRLKLPFAIPEPPVAVSDGAPAGERASVEIVDGDLCGRFVARVFHDVAVGESPAKIANRLTAMGMRPINSLVDISNYVMLELGQPGPARRAGPARAPRTRR